MLTIAPRQLFLKFRHYRTKMEALFLPFSTLCANVNIGHLVLVIIIIISNSRHARLN